MGFVLSSGYPTEHSLCPHPGAGRASSASIHHHCAFVFYFWFLKILTLFMPVSFLREKPSTRYWWEKDRFFNVFFLLEIFFWEDINARYSTVCISDMVIIDIFCLFWWFFMFLKLSHIVDKVLYLFIPYPHFFFLSFKKIFYRICIYL